MATLTESSVAGTTVTLSKNGEGQWQALVTAETLTAGGVGVRKVQVTVLLSSLTAAQRAAAKTFLEGIGEAVHASTEIQGKEI